MKTKLLELLRCPACVGSLELRSPVAAEGEIRSGVLSCGRCGREYPIVDFIPRFVAGEGYAGSFGLQWNRWRETQLDSRSGAPISRDRFLSFTGWSPAEITGRSVLDVGCGAGRFTEVALAAGAEVVALDYSTAVDACRANLGAHPGLHLVQADLYRPPFEPESFEYVYCLGVLQHTPDVHGAFNALVRQLAPGGRLAVDVYPWLLRNVLWPKYWLRPLTRRMSPQSLHRAVERMVDALLPLSVRIGRLPVVGRSLRYALPVVNYEGVYPLSPTQLREWAVLDTFDMLSPAHDHPQRPATVRAWMREAGLEDVEVGRAGFIVARGRRPAPQSAGSDAMGAVA